MIFLNKVNTLDCNRIALMGVRRDFVVNFATQLATHIVIRNLVPRYEYNKEPDLTKL